MRRWMPLVCVIAILWQFGVFIIALASSIGSSSNRPEINAGTSRLIETLWLLDRDAQESAQTFFEENRKEHFANFPANAPSSETPLDEWGIPLYIEEPSARALQAINQGLYDLRLVPIVLELPQSQSMQGDVWKDLSRNAAALVFFTHGRFEEGALLFSGAHVVYDDAFKKAASSFHDLLKSPRDFATRHSLVRSLDSMSYSDWLRQALCDHYWRLAEFATSDRDRAMLLQDIQTACVSGYTGPPWTWRKECLVASCRLLASSDAESMELPRTVARLADLEAEKGDNRIAASIYRSVVDKRTDSPEWGRCVLNSGRLWNTLREPVTARESLKVIFDSKVNDLEPGSHIMEAYRNYRNACAVEMANSYLISRNYPLAYLWYYRSAYLYPYRSWCGTCRSGAQREQQTRLLVQSMKAGPVFILWNLVTVPAVGLVVVSGLIALSLLARRWLSRRQRI